MANQPKLGKRLLIYVAVALAFAAVAFVITTIFNYDFHLSGVNTLAIFLAAGTIDYLSRKYKK